MANSKDGPIWNGGISFFPSNTQENVGHATPADAYRVVQSVNALEDKLTRMRAMKLQMPAHFSKEDQGSYEKGLQTLNNCRMAVKEAVAEKTLTAADKAEQTVVEPIEQAGSRSFGM